MGKITLQLNSFGWLDHNLIMGVISTCALGVLEAREKCKMDIKMSVASVMQDPIKDGILLAERAFLDPKNLTKSFYVCGLNHVNMLMNVLYNQTNYS